MSVPGKRAMPCLRLQAQRALAAPLHPKAALTRCVVLTTSPRRRSLREAAVRGARRRLPLALGRLRPLAAAVPAAAA